LKRVFYYSGHHLTIFHWKNENCIASFVFNPGEAGFEKFKTYLMETDNTPVRILIDLIEEGFNIEAIPHVGSTDRRAIISRMIERQYRKSIDYVYYKIIGRETGGRRDDILLCSVLSNPEILEPWLNVLNECNTSICGIWSLPQLSQSLLLKLDIKIPNILMISQQVPNILRQTFIKNGVFQSSRSAVVNLQDASIGQYISLEVEQTIRFIANQRHIGFDENIEVHIMCRECDIQGIKNCCTDSVSLSFHYHKLSDIINILGCNLQTIEQNSQKTTDDCKVIFSYVCALKLLPVGHYGNQSLFVKYYEQMFSRALYALSSVILLLSVIITLTCISDSNALDKEIITLKEQAEVVNNQYKKNLLKLEHKLFKAQSMQSSVLLAKKIQGYKSLSPQNFMSDISRILTRTGMNGTEITRIRWQQRQSNVLPVVNNKSHKRQIDYSKSENINQHATIEGHIVTSNSSLKASVKKVNLIADAFKSSQLISQIKINKIPFDYRSKSSIENESGIEQENSGEQYNNKSQFEIELIMKDNKS